MRPVARSKSSDGEVEAVPPRGWARNIIYTAAGYAIEWLAVYVSWLHIRWPDADANRAWRIALLIVLVWSVECAVESDDVYLIRRSWSRRHVRQRRR